MKKSYAGYFFDLDGTIYRGTEVIPAAKELVLTLQAQKTPFLFLTNNTTKTPMEVCQNLARLFDIHVSEKTVYTAGLATLAYLTSQNLGKSVYIIGEAGLKEILLSNGFYWETNRPTYVVVGLDSQVTYQELTIAVMAIQAGAIFIGTNADKNIPKETGLFPGAGALLAFIEAATQVKPFIIGKPSSFIINKAVEKIGLPKESLLLVGDNYQTDMVAGINNGIDTLLVLTGYTKASDLQGIVKQPTYICESLADWRM